MYHYDGGPINGQDGGITPKVRADRPPVSGSLFTTGSKPALRRVGQEDRECQVPADSAQWQLIHENVERLGPTVATLKIPEAPTNPIGLQGDHGAVAFRNIYIRPLRPFSGSPASDLQPTRKCRAAADEGPGGPPPAPPKQ